MPAFNLPDGDIERLIAFIRANPAVAEPAASLQNVRAIPFSELAAPRAGDWLSYHGHLHGNRHSSLAQIGTANVGRLAPRWIFTVPGSARLEMTPVVADGVMYATAVNEVYALDARNGRVLWRFQRPRTPGLAGDAAGGINRGVALLGTRVFLVTDNAHLLALDRATGKLAWDVEMADSRENYGATSAPLAVKDLIISGTSGGDEGARGFVAAYKAETGERVWRFWTIPKAGEPLAKTWAGSALEHGCTTAWLTGTYDPDLDLLYWTTGNPCPDYNGDERQGDNLYSDSVLALKPATGELKWYYQFTPHDLHDWDAQETPMLIDAPFGGTEKHLLVQANRNGFFYLLDRTDGRFLLAKPFVDKLTWASGIGADGRPQLLPGAEPTAEGAHACPAVEGATNWYSTAFHPGTGFFYVMSVEKCAIYTKGPAVWQAGKSYYGGTTRRVPEEAPKKYLRALDPKTGRRVWEVPQEGRGNTWGGVLSTAGGVVFFGDDSGDFAAVDATTGQRLWRWAANASWKASPMTYLANGRQYVAIAGGPNILSFALPEE
jgi:alcohol dehydrogenase (cytochrome c)